MSTQSNQQAHIEEVDEALYWASVTDTRGKEWADWVDRLLDERLSLNPPTPHPHPANAAKQQRNQTTRNNTRPDG